MTVSWLFWTLKPDGVNDPAKVSTPAMFWLMVPVTLAVREDWEAADGAAGATAGNMIRITARGPPY